MVRESRIKSYDFGAFTPTSGTNRVAYTDNPLNGELLAIEIKSDSTGSIYLYTSGVNEQVWARNSVSGNLAIIDYPFVYGVTNAAATGSPQAVYNRVLNNKLWYSGLGFEGGSVIYFSVKYR